jgi:gluconolactonase
VKRATQVFRFGLPLALAVWLVSSQTSLSQGKKKYPKMGTIERLDPRFDKLVPKGAVIEKLADGHKWTEGPVWYPMQKCLLFSDIPQNTIFKWKEGQDKVTVFMKPSGYTGKKERRGGPGDEPGSNGLLLDPQGRLVLCEHGDRRVSRREKNGKKTTLVDNYQGSRLNSPNDGVFKSNGDLYFTDPPYGLLKNNDDPEKELKFNGVYRLKIDPKDPKKNTLTLLTREMTFPNGIAFSPDEKYLYVSNSDPQKAIWMRFPVRRNGTLGRGEVFFDATKWAGKKKGLPDGMKVDKKGNLFATGPGGVLVFSPDGDHLGTINTGERTSNCNWGDDGTVLYITADHKLCRIKLSTTGKGF